MTITFEAACILPVTLTSVRALRFPETSKTLETEISFANNVSSSKPNNKPIQGNPSASSNISSEDLLRRIQEAANDIDKQSSSEPEPYEPERASEARTYNDVPRIDQLSPAVLTQMPGMSFSAHMYASNPIDRWVRVNGKRLGEGDYISDDLQLLRIEPDRVILSFKGDDFRMNALSDW